MDCCSEQRFRLKQKKEKTGNSSRDGESRDRDRRSTINSIISYINIPSTECNGVCTVSIHVSRYLVLFADCRPTGSHGPGRADGRRFLKFEFKKIC